MNGPLARVMTLALAASLFPLASTWTSGRAAASRAQASTQSSAPGDRERAADFDRLYEFIRDRYCYFAEKTTDWEAVRARYRPAALAAPDREAFIRVLEQVLDELYDPHTHLNTHLGTSWRLPAWDIWAEWRGDRALIVEVRPESSAARAGVRAGQEVLQVDNTRIERAAAARMPRCLRRPDPAARDWALRSVLSGRRDRDRQLTVRTASGSERSIRLNDRNHEAPALAAAGRVTGRRLDGGLGYLRIGTFGDAGVVEEFDRHLDTLRDAPGLILDVRNNPGGDTAVARPIMGRFITKRRQYAWMARREGSGLSERWAEYVEPRGPWTYTGPVVVLVNHWTASMPEGFAMGLDGMGRATVVGTRMAGLGAAIARIRLPHLNIGAQISAEPVYHVDGTTRHRFVPRVLADPAGSDGTARPDQDPLLEKAALELQRLLPKPRR